LAAVAGCSSVATAGDPVDDEPKIAREPVVEVPAEVTPPRPVLYAADRTLSPLTPDIAARLRAVVLAGGGRPDVVAKIGDSHTAASDYLACLGTKRMRLAEHAYLAPTVAWFSAAVDGGTSWTRKSLAAVKGWPAFRALAGAPSPIDRELAELEPAFATVMFGTNDIGYMHLDRYGRNLLDIADVLLARGVVPIISSIPARGDDKDADEWVPRYNAVARAVAQARQVPFVDLHRDLAAVPGKGLHGDRVHLISNSTGCTFDARGLRYAGANRRNLLTLEVLDDLRRAVIEGEPAPDAEAPRLAGAGTAIDPYVIPSLPFGDARDTRTEGTRLIDRYGRARSDESGPEIFYRLDVTRRTKLRAYLVDRTGDHDLHLLAGAPSPTALVARGDEALDRTLPPGTYYLVVDTHGERPGEYLLALP
jgi:hypothetical protein